MDRSRPADASLARIVKLSTADEALRLVDSNMRVFVQGAAATPSVLLQALAHRARGLRGIETVHLHLEGPAPHADPSLQQCIRPCSFFVGPNLRTAVAEHRAD